MTQSRPCESVEAVYTTRPNDDQRRILNMKGKMAMCRTDSPKEKAAIAGLKTTNRKINNSVALGTMIDERGIAA